MLSVLLGISVSSIRTPRPLMEWAMIAEHNISLRDTVMLRCNFWRVGTGFVPGFGTGGQESGPNFATANSKGISRKGISRKALI